MCGAAKGRDEGLMRDTHTNRRKSFRPRTGTRTMFMLIHKDDLAAQPMDRDVARPDACDTPVFSVAFHTRQVSFSAPNRY